MKWFKRKRKHRGKVWVGNFGIIYWLCYTCEDQYTNDQGRLMVAPMTLDWASDIGGMANDINQGSDLLRNHLLVVHGEVA